MRFFISLEIPEESIEQIASVQHKVKQLIPEANLTFANKLHLTIAFIGEQPEAIKERLIKLLAQASTEIPPFSVTPAYLDGFPNLHHAHTLWLGVKGDIDKLMIIRERIKDGLEELNLPVDERRYTPHITIAKVPSGFKLRDQQEEQFQQLMIDHHFDPISIKALKLFESVPDEGFHKHNTLAEVRLS